MAYTALDPADVDARSPITDVLMNLIRTDLDDLDSRINALGSNAPAEWRVNGSLDTLPALTPASLGVEAERFKLIDSVFVAREATFTQNKLLLATPGDSGTLEIDVRKFKALDYRVQSIAPIFEDSITSISEITATNTQSITRATPQVSTQSITYFKSALSVASIQVVEAGMQVNFSTAFDADWRVGDTVTIASATDGANNGAFEIVAIVGADLKSLILENASAVAQAGAAGTGQLMAFVYNLSASANANFVAGESAIFASHTSAVNDGVLSLYAVNSGGNNLVVKNATGATQGGAAGTIDCARLSFNFSSSAGAEFVVGQSVVTASHSSGNNNGTFVIRAVNSGGNNLILSNTVITLQGGVAGTCKSLWKVVNLNTDPAAVSTSDNVVIAGASSAIFDGVFAVQQVKRGGTNNLVIYVTTAGTGTGTGTLRTSLCVVSLDADPSADITTSSRVDLSGCVDGNNGSFSVVAVNVSSGTNVKIENVENVTQALAGRIESESKSLFTSRPSLSFSYGAVMQVDSGTLGAEAVVETGDLLSMEIVQVPVGTTDGLTFQLY